MGPQGLEREIMRSMKRFGNIHFRDAHRRMSHGEFIVMVTLERYEDRYEGAGMRASQLAEMAEASPQALSRTLKSLEGKGYIRRQADQIDRRHICINLTEEARQVLHEGQARMKRMFDQVIEQMGEEDIRTMVSLVNRMSDIMINVQGEIEEDEDDFLDA